MIAEEFRLVDSSGRLRAILGTQSPWSTAQSPTDHVGLTLYDTRGLVRTQLAWEERRERDSTTLGVAALHLRNRSGVAQNSIQLTEHQYFTNATATLTDAAGRTTWLHPASLHLSGPGASLSLGQRDKEPNARLYLEGEDGHPRLVFTQTLGPEAQLAPILEIRNSAGKASWMAP